LDIPTGNSVMEYSLREQNESRLCVIRTGFTGRELLKKLGLRHVRNVREKRGEVVFCTDKDSDVDERKYCFKYGLEERCRDRFKKEFRAIKFLFPVLKKLSFRTLQIPEVIRYSDSPGDKIKWILFRDHGPAFPWSEDIQENHIWVGKAMDLSSVPKIVSVLADLKCVDVKDLPFFVKKRNLGEWLAKFERHLKGKPPFIERPELDRTKTIVEKNLLLFNESDFILNPGDFYPRNLVSFENKIVALDWESVHTEPVEGIVAHLWMLMWNNPAWQRCLIKETQKHFRLKPRVFQTILLAKTFTQIYEVWPRNWEEAREKQIDYARQALDLGYVKAMLR
jgi:hypothetical protein